MGYRPAPPSPGERPDESGRPQHVPTRSSSPDRAQPPPDHGELSQGDSHKDRGASLTVDPARSQRPRPAKASNVAPTHNEGTRPADPGIQGGDVPSTHDAGTENDLIAEARDDWDNGAVPVLKEIQVY